MNAVSSSPRIRSAPGAIEALNRACCCIGVDPDALARVPPGLELEQGGKYPVKAISRGVIPDAVIAGACEGAGGGSRRSERLTGQSDGSHHPP